MKIALMSGAYVNAGDFLIEKRCKILLEKNIKDAHIDVFKRNVSYDNRIEELNQYDLIVIGGGPGYQKNMYPDEMPFVSNLNEVKVPVTILGWGGAGTICTERSLYKYEFSSQMLEFLNYIDKQNSILGCRDWYAVRFLKNHGLKNLMMTGCPAWYDLEKIETLTKPKNVLEKDDLNICVSDAAAPRNKELIKDLLMFLRKKYPKAKIQMVFHRCITEIDKKLIEDEFMQRNSIKPIEITGSADGFCVYDACDIHIGFRVHAHIYNLSRGNASILINEDMRGMGVNDALGLRNINLGTRRKFNRIGVRDMIKAVDDYLCYISETDYRPYKNASENIQFYYNEMQNYLRLLEGGIC